MAEFIQLSIQSVGWKKCSMHGHEHVSESGLYFPPRSQSMQISTITMLLGESGSRQQPNEQQKLLIF